MIFRELLQAIKQQNNEQQEQRRKKLLKQEQQIEQLLAQTNIEPQQREKLAAKATKIKSALAVGK